jgi:hypothetical protein
MGSKTKNDTISKLSLFYIDDIGVVTWFIIVGGLVMFSNLLSDLQAYLFLTDASHSRAVR